MLFAPHALHTLRLAIFCIYVIDHVEPKLGIQAEQAQGVFGGPQVSSCKDANIVVIRASPGETHQSPCLLCLKLYL
jgi:hypothetical protein